MHWDLKKIIPFTERQLNLAYQYFSKEKMEIFQPNELNLSVVYIYL